MANKGKTVRGAFGTLYHYDEKGRKIGRSEPRMLGGYTNYDSKGKKTGHTNRGILNSYNHYDNNGRKTGSTSYNGFGQYNHRNANGKVTGSSNKSFGGYNHNDTAGCYIATSVYGSYDCPQVWTLRRLRDHKLSKTYPGRLFIRIYYMLSPTIVRLFGKQAWFQLFWRRNLDKMVNFLNQKGVENTPYQDEVW